MFTVVIFVAAYQTTRHWGDLFVLLGFSVLGIFMKRFVWPRPPLIVAIVLERLGETYFFLATRLYGIYWMTRPIVIVLFLLIVLTLVHTFLRERRDRREKSRRDRG